jgi:hypothetical protein
MDVDLVLRDIKSVQQSYATADISIAGHSLGESWHSFTHRKMAAWAVSSTWTGLRCEPVSMSAFRPQKQRHLKKKV